MVQQSEVISFLESVECIRIEQMTAYLKKKFDAEDSHIQAAYNQLRAKGKIMMKSGYISLPGRQPNSDTLSAIDIMMSVTKNNVASVIIGHKLYKLVFSMIDKEGTEIYFGIVLVKPWTEDRICRQLQSIQDEITVIFVLDNEEQQHLLTMNGKYYFALQDTDGHFKFFKPARSGRQN